MRTSPLILGTLLVAVARSGAAQETIETWTYHHFPPYIVSEADKAGLTYDLVDLMNRASGKKWVFKLKIIPKKRLDEMMERGEKGIVVMAPDMIYGGVAGGKYRWTGPILHDQQTFLSLNSKKVDFSGQPASLYPYNLGGVLGHTYFGIQDDINAGKIARHDVSNETSLFDMLIGGRLEVICLPYSASRYFVHRKNAHAHVHFSKQPLNEFDRRIVLQNGMPDELQAFLTKFTQDLQANPAWGKKLKVYGL